MGISFSIIKRGEWKGRSGEVNGGEGDPWGERMDGWMSGWDCGRGRGDLPCSLVWKVYTNPLTCNRRGDAVVILHWLIDADASMIWLIAECHGPENIAGGEVGRFVDRMWKNGDDGAMSVMMVIVGRGGGVVVCDVGVGYVIPLAWGVVLWLQVGGQGRGDGHQEAADGDEDDWEVHFRYGDVLLRRSVHLESCLNSPFQDFSHVARFH